MGFNKDKPSTIDNDNANNDSIVDENSTKKDNSINFGYQTKN